MTVQVQDVRKVVVIGWDLDLVKGSTASIQTGGTEIRVVKNDGESNIFFPLDWSGETVITVEGSKGGSDTGVIAVSGEETQSNWVDGPSGGGEPAFWGGDE